MLLHTRSMTRGLSTAVLVVDDDDSVRRVLVALLAGQGHTVFEAADGQDAWRQLQYRQVDVVVTDLQMPVCDGRELCRRIRSDPAMRHLGLLVVTGCTNHAERQSLDCDCLLSKPLSIPHFLDAVNRFCQRLAPISTPTVCRLSGQHRYARECLADIRVERSRAILASECVG